MDKKTYGTLAEATRVDRPECADEGDLLIVPPGNPIRLMEMRSIARLGLSCGRTGNRSDNTCEAVARLFRGGKTGSPLVLRISDVRKAAAPSGRRAQMLALIGNGHEPGEAPRAPICSCGLQLVYNGEDCPWYADETVATNLMAEKAGNVMANLQQMKGISGRPLADAATKLAWSAFSHVCGVVDGTKPRAESVPETIMPDPGAREWSVDGNISPEGFRAVAEFLANWRPESAPVPVIVTGRFLAEAGKRGCVAVKCPQVSAFAARARLKSHAEMCAEAWRCRARALDMMRQFALRDLAVARARAENFDRIARKISDGKADYAFLQCMSGWKK